MSKNPLSAKTLLVLAAAALCAGAGVKVYTAKGLVTGAPGKSEYPVARPGKTSVLPRAYDGAPPFIPHSVKGMRVMRSRNQCLTCHVKGMKFGADHVATKIPASHYLNEHTQERSEGRVAGIRYNCLQCHTQQSSAIPPVGQMGN